MILENKTSPEEIKDLYLNKNWSLRRLAKYYFVSTTTIKRYLHKQNVHIKTERILLLDTITNPTEIYDLYWNKKYSLNEIANIFKISNTTAIKNYLLRHGIKLRSSKEGCRNYFRKYDNFISSIDKNTTNSIKRLHWKENKSLSEIIKILKYDISLTHLIRVFKKNNIQYRNAIETRLLRNKLNKDRKHKINDSFFSDWTPEMAYVLGWIYTDGCIDEYRFRIATYDIEVLENIKKLMESTHKVLSSTQSQVRALEIRNRKMVKDLIKYGLHQNKSLTIKFPDIPKKFIRHFIRGVFEGDGTTWIQNYKSNNRENSIIISFSSGSPKFLNGLNQAININTKNISLKNIIKKDGNCYELSYAKYDSWTLFNYMYNNAPMNMTLKRKYDILENFFSPHNDIGHKLLKIVKKLSSNNRLIYIKDITDIYNLKDKLNTISYLKVSNILKVYGFNKRGRNSNIGVYIIVDK